MQNNFFLKYILLGCISLLLIACDKDFNEIGSDIIDDDHFGLLYNEATTVAAYNQSVGSIQSNNLPINALGYYNNPYFGKTKASFVSQVELASVNPTIGANPTITKVQFSVPYFSTLTETDNETGNHTYELDSIHGSSKIKLSVYESKYYLRDHDASTNFQENQVYYSADGIDFDNNKNPERLNDDVSADQNDAFFFDPSEIRTYKTVNGEQVVDTRTKPEMRLSLKKEFFQSKIFGTAASGKLLNNGTFKEYFRGLYFKVENAATSPEQGSLAMIDFTKGTVEITYNITITASNGTTTTEEKTMEINLSGNTVNVFENEYQQNYLSGITSPNTTNGDQRLFPKGGTGSVVVVSLFGAHDLISYDSEGVLQNVPNYVSDELDHLRNPADGKKWMVNEANLVFYVDTLATSLLAETDEPERLYLFDLNNNKPIKDYFTDNTIATNPKNSKYFFGGIVEKEKIGDKKRGIKYKIRVTNHIKDLIANDSTNVKLGLVVTESIGITAAAKLKTPFTIANQTAQGYKTITKAPIASVFSPLGTILYGTIPAPIDNNPISVKEYAKRLKLEIYYTKPN
jgi:hypothetical protein